MKNSFFQFKQFMVVQENCPMKVNTDSCLLAAWAVQNDPREDISSILDIGTGTGVLALMLAQHWYKCQQVIGVEIDPVAALQAENNFAMSKWASHFSAVNDSIQHFSEGCSGKFDLIISNPPYFSNSLQAVDARKNLARHDVSLSYEDLAGSVAKLLAVDGIFYVVLPFSETQKFEAKAWEKGLQITARAEVVPIPHKLPNRVILTLRKTGTSTVLQGPSITRLTIRKKENEYTEEFLQLLREYYLFL